MQKPNQINSLLRLHAERARQALVLGSVLFFSAIMCFAVVEVRAANNASSTTNLNVVAGALAIEAAPSAINFNSGAAGQTVTANTGTGSNNIKWNDTTGSGGGYSIVGWFNTNFVNTGSTQLPINAAARLGWFPGSATITNITTTGGLSAGANNNFTGLTSANNLTLVTGTGASSGGAAYLENLKFNYNIATGASTADYQTTLFMLIS
jgi:hypothetical protein